MNRYTAALLISAGLLLPYQAFAQQDTAKKDTVSITEKVDKVQGQVDGINEDYLATKATVDGLAKLKISGYIQSQFQYGDTMGISTNKSMGGPGSFGIGVQDRFQVRRGRLKTTYDNSWSKYVLQLDLTPGNGTGGLAVIKEVYLAVKEPWLKTFALNAGVHMRPFGFELPLSSGDRESPEMSRIIQTLFPGEYEIGASVDMAAPEGPLSMFTLSAGAFNGTKPDYVAIENDDNKDAIGRLGIKLPMKEAGIELDGGFSAYVGKVTNTDTTGGTGVEYEMSGGNFVKTTGTKNVNYDRQYLGGDAQFYYDVPFIGGMTLRGEYIAGKNPGDKTSAPYIPAAAASPNGSLYERNFAGGYIYYVQNIMTPLQLVFKFDWYDPNTDLAGSKINNAFVTDAVNKAVGDGDIAWTTIGFGAIYHWDGNVKFLLYYEMPKNETVASDVTGAMAKYKTDITDNVLTFRVQYKF
ncbi:MAG: hypothetical protein PHC61_08525 [Chitinivibrionales bacterium]|nr:hypothetical protein [Chitinivibrionales bacterium]